MPFNELAKAVNVIFDLTGRKIKSPYMKILARRLKGFTSAQKDENGEMKDNKSPNKKVFYHLSNKGHFWNVNGLGSCKKNASIKEIFL